MKGFIEVHVDGEPLLINVAQITDVAPRHGHLHYHCSIHAWGLCEVDETYGLVKALIEEAMR